MADSFVVEDNFSSSQALPQVSLLRLYLLRVTYLVMGVGIGLTYWPTVLRHGADLPIGFALAFSLLAGLGLVALLGLRYPLQMLPILIYEFVWKAVFLIAFALPLWRNGHIDDASAEYISACLMVIVFVPLVPWRYVVARYLRQPSERWR